MGRQQFIDGSWSAVVAAFALSSCIPDSVVGPGASTTGQAIEAVQNAINALNTNSASWQVELNRLESQTNQDVKSLINNDVTNLLQRGVGTAGVEVRCDADFIGARTKAGLQGLLAKLKGESPPPPPPAAVCQVSPTSLDMEHRPNTINWYGYDFDVGDVQVALQHSGGEVPLTAAVFRPTHYLLTLDTSNSSAAPVCNLENRRIVVRANGAEISSVSVARMQCPGAPPTPSPAARKNLLDANQDCAGGIGGCRDDRQLGGLCEGGYHRAQCQVVKLEGGGHCEQKDWASADPHDCSCIVHFGAPAFQGVKCRVTITEDGDQQPPLPPPPCTCW